MNEPGRRDTAYLGRLLLQLHAAAVAEPARMEVPVPSLSFRSVDTYVLRTAVFRGSEFELGHYDKVSVVTFLLIGPEKEAQHCWR